MQVWCANEPKNIHFQSKATTNSFSATDLIESFAPFAHPHPPTRPPPTMILNTMEEFRVYFGVTHSKKFGESSERGKHVNQ